MPARKRPQPSQRDRLIAAVMAKHDEQTEKHNKKLARMRKSGDYSAMETPLWMQTWDFPVLMYKSDAHLTLEDIVDVILKELE